MGSASHHRNGFSGQHELSEIDRNPFHPSEQDMIPAPGIEDQELPIGAERAGEDHPAIAGRGDLRPGPGGNGKALFDAAEPIRGPIFLDFRAINRKRNLSAQLGKGHRRRHPPGIAERR